MTDPVSINSIGRKKFTPRPAICAGCGAGFIKNSGVHRVCSECRRRRVVAIYHKSNERSAARAIQKGLATNEAHVGTLASTMPREMEFEWVVRFAFPFDQAGSKNSRLYRGPSQGTHEMALQRRHRSYQDALILRAKAAMAGRIVRRNKVWLDIFVQMPHHRGDAVNFVDMVCDALKVALKVDDKWFCIYRLDFEVCKTDPRLFIGIAQESVEDARACRSCGLIKPDASFSRNRVTPTGRDWQCKECQSVAAPITRSERRALEG